MESMVKKLKQDLRAWSSGEKKEEDLKQSWFLYNGSIFLKGLKTKLVLVYSFGVFLMVLLTARPALVSAGSDGEYKGIIGYVKGLYVNGKLGEVIDPMMFKDNANGQRLQVEACVMLVLRCCEERDEDRPKMIQVAKELKRIETSLRSSSCFNFFDLV